MLVLPPYPATLVREHHLVDGRLVVIRPIRSADEAALRRFYDALSPDAKQLRFMKYVRAVNEKLIHSFSHIDYDNHMAFVCEAGGELVGEARYVREGEGCEFSVVIADGWHKTGIAGLLMNALIACGRSHGVKTMEGLVLRQNRTMLKFVRALGFDVETVKEDATLARVAKKL